MGRQSLILARWNPLFADIPAESQTFERQAEYYQALEESTRRADSAPFVTFMLRMILDTVASFAPQVTLGPPSNRAAAPRYGTAAITPRLGNEEGGISDFYWVSTEVITKLKTAYFKE